MENRKIIFFDGVCNLCSGSVQFLLKRNPKEDLYFSPIGSQTFAKIKLSCAETAVLPDSILFYDGITLRVESDAVLHLSQYLKFPYSCLFYLSIVPKIIRDRVYRFIAKNRYQWFGKTEFCMVPSPNLKKRFLD